LEALQMKKSTISNAIALALGSVSFAAQASLTTSATLAFDPGVKSCVIGGTFPNCTHGVSNVTSGSFFSMDTNQDGITPGSEKTVISMNEGVHIGTLQPASGSHGGAPGTGTVTESPSIDNPWLFFSNTGMSFTAVNPVTVVTDSGTTKTLDFSGWRVTWNGIPAINMGGGPQGTINNGSGLATIVCSNSSCSASSTYTLDYTAVVPQGDPSNFGGVTYKLHLVGHVEAVPVPAAAWLFGSGLVGLVGIARRRKVRA
jgi:hypothetical protein